MSFANCGLPYYVGGVIADRADLLLQTPETLSARFDLDVRVRHEALAIDRDRRVVRVRDHDGGTEFDLRYDTLVLATGAAPVRPPIPGVERARVLRDVADVDAIVAEFERTARAARPSSAADSSAWNSPRTWRTAASR